MAFTSKHANADEIIDLQRAEIYKLKTEIAALSKQAPVQDRAPGLSPDERHQFFHAVEREWYATALCLLAKHVGLE